MASSGTSQSQTVRYTIRASEHSGGDLVLWLRYLSKWVNPSGHIFSERDLAQIMRERRIRPAHKVIFTEALKPGTPTNEYVVKMRQPYDNSEVLKMIERFRANEKTDTA